MRVKDAELNKPYKLLMKGFQGNKDFDNAIVTFTNISKDKSFYQINFTKVDGHSGNTAIAVDDGNWEIDPLEKDWDQ